MGLVYLPALGVVDRLFQAYPDTTHGTADQLGWFGRSKGRHIWQSHGQSHGVYGSATLLVTSATLVVTGALLVVTCSNKKLLETSH